METPTEMTPDKSAEEAAREKAVKAIDQYYPRIEGCENEDSEDHREDLIELLTSTLAPVEEELEKWKKGCEVNADNARDALRKSDEQRLEIKSLTSERDELKRELEASHKVIQIDRAHEMVFPDASSECACPSCNLHRGYTHKHKTELQSLKAENERLRGGNISSITCIHHNDAERGKAKQCPVCALNDLTTLKAKLERVEKVEKVIEAYEKSDRSLTINPANKICAFEAVKEISSIMKGGV